MPGNSTFFSYVPGHLFPCYWEITYLQMVRFLFLKYEVFLKNENLGWWKKETNLPTSKNIFENSIQGPKFDFFLKKCQKQAGAELCQAQHSLS